MNQLLNVERWIEQLIEEPFVKLFAGRLLPHDVARHLVRALEDGERFGADGRSEVPGRYRIELNADDLTALRRHHPDLDEQLTLALIKVVERMDLRTHQTPGVKLEAGADLPPRGVRIMSADRVAPIPNGTQDIDPSQIRQVTIETGNESRTQAYLIIKGDRTFDLTQAQVALGRALDNDVILEDRRISRYHARLRRRYGRYIMEDLGSTGGTTVNGFPVQEIVLRAGDLISLSGVDIIYVEAEPLERVDRGETQPFRPVTG
jgi:FHA domain-containing protein